MIAEAYQKTLDLLREHQDKLEILAQDLLENEVVDQRRLEELLNIDLESENADFILRHQRDPLVGVTDDENETSNLSDEQE